MKLEPPGVYVVTTRTSVYRIDTGALNALRSRRPGGQGAAANVEEAAEGGFVVVHRRLFTDGAPLVLTEVPEPVLGQRMRLRVRVADEFLDYASKGKPTDMVTTEVVSVFELVGEGPVESG